MKPYKVVGVMLVGGEGEMRGMSRRMLVDGEGDEGLQRQEDSGAGVLR